MSKSAIEVVTSVQPRGRWAATEKEPLVAASPEPESGLAAVAHRLGFTRASGWRRQLCL